MAKSPPNSASKGAVPDSALIRNAVGLTADEKNFLYTVASHKGGESYASVETLREHTGLSRNRLYRTRRSLLDKGLIVVQEHPGGTTSFRIRKATLRALAADGQARRQRRRRARLSGHRTSQPVSEVGTTPAHFGTAAADGTRHDRDARSGHVSRDDSGPAKANGKAYLKVNTKTSMNTKGGQPATTGTLARAVPRKRIVRRRPQTGDGCRDARAIVGGARNHACRSGA